MPADRYPYECGVWKATAKHSCQQLEMVVRSLKRNRSKRHADDVRILEGVMEALRPERVEAFVQEWHDKGTRRD